MNVKSNAPSPKLPTSTVHGHVPPRPTVKVVRGSRSSTSLVQTTPKYSSGSDTSGEEALARELYRAELRAIASRRQRTAAMCKSDEALAKRLAQEGEDSESGSSPE